MAHAETLQGIEVTRVWTYISANEGFLKRTLDYASFMISGALAALGVRDVDVIVATSPQLFTPCAAYVAGLLKRRPYVFELRDLWPESIRAVGAMKTTRGILNALERLKADAEARKLDNVVFRRLRSSQRGRPPTGRSSICPLST